MCDWEGCTTGTIRPPNSNQRRVAKTSGFPHPLYIQVHRAGVLPGENLGARGMKDNPDGTSVATGNRAIFSAYRILATHKGRRPVAAACRWVYFGKSMSFFSSAKTALSLTDRVLNAGSFDVGSGT